MQIEKEKFRIFMIFLHVPVVVIRRLAQTAQTGYDAARMAIDSDLANAMDDEEQHDADVSAAMVIIILLSVHSRTTVCVLLQFALNWDKIDFSKSKPRKMTRSYTHALLLCFEFSLPAILCIVSRDCRQIMNGLCGVNPWSVALFAARAGLLHWHVQVRLRHAHQHHERPDCHAVL